MAGNVIMIQTIIALKFVTAAHVAKIRVGNYQKNFLNRRCKNEIIASG